MFVRHSILLLCAVLMGIADARGQSFRNLDFEQTCDTCKIGLADWGISWQADSVKCHADGKSGERALLIASANANGVGFVEQGAVVSDTTQLRIVSVSVSIRSEEVKGGRGAGIYLTGYDPANQLIFSKDMGYGSFKWVLGTRSAKRYSMKAVCPAGVAMLKIGFILYGEGRVWFDDVNVATSIISVRQPGPAALAYVDAACDKIRLHSLRKDSIDLPALRAVALRIAGNANEPDDHHLAVEYLLQGLEDHHSFFMDPELKKMWEGGGEDGIAIEQATHRIIKGYGYIAVPHFQREDDEHVVLIRAP